MASCACPSNPSASAPKLWQKGWVANRGGRETMGDGRDTDGRREEEGDRETENREKRNGESRARVMGEGKVTER